MSFDRSWLELREPFDRRARSERLREAVTSWIHQQPRTLITDLGAGTGSTFRYLSPHIGSEVEWTFVDHHRDNVELAAAQCGARAVVADLARTIPPLGDLVTASAFFDLVSKEWVERFVTALDGRPLYVTLTVDGRDELAPGDSDDEWVNDAFRRHQTETDKGFGRALGPGAHDVLVETLRRHGYRVDEARSDWHIYNNRELRAALFSGMAERAAELSGDRARADGWLRRRLEKRVMVTVGHRDLFALPGGSRS